MRIPTKPALFSLIIIVLLTWAAALTLPDGRLHVVFLDVGQGDAIFITTPNGRQILIDGGPGPGQLLAGLGRHMPFWDRSIDVLVSTHPEADHLTGLLEIVGRYRVGTVLVSDVALETALFDAWQGRLAEAGLKPLAVGQGARLELDREVSALVLNPGPASVSSPKPNDHSIVIRLEMGQISFLLPGDIEAGVERALVGQNLPLQATILKSPHHGSNTSSSAAFLDAVNPQLVVISAGADNRFGHPAQAVLDRYTGQRARVLRTDELGPIEFITDGRDLWLKGQR
ncbi:MAG: ComEC/Rec2 family competence protein [Anaerolineae bacterium]